MTGTLPPEREPAIDWAKVRRNWGFWAFLGSFVLCGVLCVVRIF